MVGAVDSWIIVEDGGWKYQVDLEKGSCSCLEFNCRHLKLATDLIRNGGAESRYLILSSLHKSIRRADVDLAFHYAALLTQIYGPSFVSYYCRKIAFEETRNPSLLTYLGHSWQADVTNLTSSVKKWEQIDRRGHVVKKSKAYQKAKELGPYGSQGCNILGKKDYYDALVDVFRLKMFDDGKKIRRKLYEYWHMMKPENPVPALGVAKKGKISTYDLILGLEMHYGFTPGDSSGYHQIPPPRPFEGLIVYPPDWSHDIHTHQGKGVLYRQWRNIHPEVRLPAGLDLRFSGSVLGCLWREAAYDQYGREYVNTPWEKVKISEEEWRQAKILDSWYYHGLYSSVEPDLCN